MRPSLTFNQFQINAVHFILWIMVKHIKVIGLSVNIEKKKKKQKRTYKYNLTELHNGLKHATVYCIILKVICNFLQQFSVTSFKLDCIVNLYTKVTAHPCVMNHLTLWGGKSRLIPQWLEEWVSCKWRDFVMMKKMDFLFPT